MSSQDDLVTWWVPRLAGIYLGLVLLPWIWYGARLGMAFVGSIPIRCRRRRAKMAEKYFGVEEVVRRVKELVAAEGGGSALARKLETFPTEIYEVIGGRRAPSRKILEALGLEKVPAYRVKTKK